MTCTIFDNSTERIASNTGWVNFTSGGRIESNMNTSVSNSRHDDDMVTSTLTIVNVSVYVNNTEYFCRPSSDNYSSVAVITVLGKKHSDHLRDAYLEV